MKPRFDDDVFRYIVRFKRDTDGISPTIREIVDGCGLSSTSVCKNVLERLQRKGKIVLSPMAHSRNIQVVGETYSVKLYD